MGLLSCAVGFRRSLALGAFALVSLECTAEEPRPTPCPQSAATVLAADAADRSDACAGAADAIGFFARLGLEATDPPSITVTAQIPAEAGPTAVGCFIERHKRIYVLPYASFRKRGHWFGVRIDRRMYRSLAAHEARIQ